MDHCCCWSELCSINANESGFEAAAHPGELAIFLGAALILAGASIWWVRRRMS
jgi:hypothetical protein